MGSFLCMNFRLFITRCHVILSPMHKTDAVAPPVPDELLALLACPHCHAPLARQADRLVCTGPDCRRRYPVRDGIPILLIDEAEAPSGD